MITPASRTGVAAVGPPKKAGALTRAKAALLLSSGLMQRLFFTLVATTAAVLVASAVIAQYGTSMLHDTVQATLTRNMLLDDIDQLHTLAGRISAPGNDVFQSKDAATEFRNLGAAVSDTRRDVDRLRDDLATNNDEWLRAQQRVYLNKIDNLLLSLSQLSRDVLVAFGRGDLTAAMAGSATLDQRLRYTQFTITKAAQAMRKSEAAEKTARLHLWETISALQGVLVVIALLIIAGLAIHGRRTALLVEARIQDFASDNAALAARVAAGTAELETAVAHSRSLAAQFAHVARDHGEAQSSQLRRDEAALRTARFDTALQNMRIGLAWFDSDRRLMACNSAYLELYGLKQSLAGVGTSLDEHISEIMRVSGSREGGGGQRILDDPFERHLEEINSAYRTITESDFSGHTVRVTSGPSTDGGRIFIHEDLTAHRRPGVRLEPKACPDGASDPSGRPASKARLAG